MLFLTIFKVNKLIMVKLSFFVMLYQFDACVEMIDRMNARRMNELRLVLMYLTLYRRIDRSRDDHHVCMQQIHWPNISILSNYTVDLSIT